MFAEYEIGKKDMMKIVKCLSLVSRLIPDVNWGITLIGEIKYLKKEKLLLQ